MPRRSRRVSAARREHERTMRGLGRVRLAVAALGLVPLGLSLGCAGQVGGLCDLPRDLYLFMWAAVVGTFVGLTIRMVRERRSFERSQQ